MTQCILDYDGTIYDQVEPSPSQENINLINELAKKLDISILTGNDCDAVKPFSPNVKVFANRGICEYKLTQEKYKREIIFNRKFEIPHEEFSGIITYLLENFEIPFSKIKLRDKVIISIKPLSELERETIVSDTFLAKKTDYEILKAGKTTVEIAKKGLNKLIAFQYYFDKIDMPKLYVGNEANGNDRPIINHHQTQFLEVKSVIDTNTFLKVLSWQI